METFSFHVLYFTHFLFLTCHSLLLVFVITWKITSPPCFCADTHPWLVESTFWASTNKRTKALILTRSWVIKNLKVRRQCEVLPTTGRWEHSASPPLHACSLFEKSLKSRAITMVLSLWKNVMSYRVGNRRGSKLWIWTIRLDWNKVGSISGEQHTGTKRPLTQHERRASSRPGELACMPQRQLIAVAGLLTTSIINGVCNRRSNPHCSWVICSNLYFIFHSKQIRCNTMVCLWLYICLFPFGLGDGALPYPFEIKQTILGHGMSMQGVSSVNEKLFLPMSAMFD